MKTAIQTRWVERLQSTTVPQAFGVLRRGDAVCAIGVLLVLDQEDHPSARWLEIGPSSWPYDRSWTAVQRWAGLTDREAEMVKQWNDQDRLSFAEIAQKIASTFSQRRQKAPRHNAS